MDQSPQNPQPPTFQPPPGSPVSVTDERSTLSSEDKTLGMVAHLTALGGFIGPLIVWLIKKDDSAFVDDQGKEALNWQISVIIYSAISAILIFFIVGIFLMIAIAVTNLVCIILGSIAAYDGRYYRYPLNLRLIR